MAFPQSRILTIQQLISQITESNSNGERFCFILGSGASVESGIPSGNTLEMEWMNCLMGEAEDRGTKPKDPAHVQKTAQALHDEKKLTHTFQAIKKEWESAKAEKRSVSSEYYFDIYKLRFYPNQRNGYRYMEALMESCEPSVGYHTLARLLTEGNLNNLVITTNFDSLVEDALFLYTTKKPLVVSHESLTGFIESDIQRPIVAKVHRGLMYEPFNSPDTTSKLQNAWRSTLNYAFSTYTPIVIGYGGGDHSLMAFLQDKKTVLRHGLYWCYRKASGLPDKKILDLLEKKNGYLVEISGFDAMMLELGEVMFGDAISDAKTDELLKAQYIRRTQEYARQWNELRKNPETKRIVSAVDAKEDQAAQEREQNNTMTVWDYRSRGRNAYNNGDYDKAVAMFAKAIELDGLFAADYGWRGLAYIELREYKKSLADNSKAIELDPKNAVAYCNRGHAYSELHEYEKAIADLNKAIELDPKDTVAYNNRGYAHNGLGEYRKALADYNKALELDPKDTVAYNNRGDTYEDMGQYKQAIADYTKAIELDPKDAIAYNNRGDTYEDMGQYEQAIADYSKAIELDPKDATTYGNRGYTYGKMGQYEKAIADCNKAIELDPGYPNAYRHRGNAYFGLKDYKKALADLTEAIRLDPKFNEAYLDRAKVYRAIGEEALAQADEAQAAKL